MSSRERSIGRVSLLVALLAAGIATPRASRAQDALVPQGSTSPSPTSDPDEPPPDAQPPPAGAPPPYAAATQQPTRMAAHRGYVAMPFVGLQSIRNSTSRTGLGLRVGGVGGARLNAHISVNGEFSYDNINIDDSSRGESAETFQLSLAPLFHDQVTPTGEIVVGPKVGFFHNAETEPYDGSSLDVGVTGWMIGGNVGAFFLISNPMELGGLIGFDYEKGTSCSADGVPCTTEGVAGRKILSLAAAALF